MTGKRLRKIIQQLLLMLHALGKWKHSPLIFQKLTQIVKTNDSLNDPKLRKRKLALTFNKKLPPFLKGITSKHDSDFNCLNCLHSFRT